MGDPGHYAGVFGPVTALVYPDRVYLDPNAEVILYHPQQLMLLQATPATAPTGPTPHDIYATEVSLSHCILLVPRGLAARYIPRYTPVNFLSI